MYLQQKNQDEEKINFMNKNNYLMQIKENVIKIFERNINQYIFLDEIDLLDEILVCNNQLFNDMSMTIEDFLFKEESKIIEEYLYFIEYFYKYIFNEIVQHLQKKQN